MREKNYKIVFMGTPDYAVVVLEGLISKNYNVCLVVTQPDKKVGRKQILSQSSVKKFALEHNLEVYQPQKIRLEFDKILECKPDLIITAAYGQIIPKELLDFPEFGCINLHGSILPNYRGGAPIQRAIINSESKTGVTLMYMDQTMDTGDIIKISEVNIDKNDNLLDVFNKMSICAKNLLLDNIENIFAKTNSRIPQNNSLATYAPNIKKEDEYIDVLNKTAQQIHDHVRGLYPFIIGNICVDGVKYKLHVTKIVDEIKTKNYHVGSFVKEDKNVYLPTHDNKFIKIKVIQKIGKKPITGLDFYNQI